MSHAALNQSREGIMCVDQLGEIININAIGMTLFQCQVGDKIFKKEAFKDIYASMINESNGIDIFKRVQHQRANYRN